LTRISNDGRTQLQYKLPDGNPLVDKLPILRVPNDNKRENIPSMLVFHIILVAIIQGITEFLPVSSSGHLVLIPLFTNWEDQSLTIDVAAHIGTLLAVIVYFRKEVIRILQGAIDVCKGQFQTPDSMLFLGLVIATIPVIIIGFIIFLLDLSILFRSLGVIGSTTLFFGLVLYACDRMKKNNLTLGNFSVRHAFILGLFQVLSLVPGTSRSGIVISGARFLGYSRREAARIAMLMSIPTIIAAGTLTGLDLIGNSNPGKLTDSLIVVLISFVSALGALGIMMRLLNFVSFTPYVIYRIILGLFLLFLAFG